ncbi:MAG: hypothetical protein JW993_21280 [Sedimentisphaerales bacterium]|nr:hypothetical protein [Sedimentisphaerales bacterium]
MRTLIAATLLALLAIGSAGCVIVDAHYHGHHRHRRPVIVRPARPHHHHYGPGYPHYGY